MEQDKSVNPSEAPVQDVGPEGRAQLQSLMDQLDQKRGQFNAIQFANKNKAENTRQDSLMKVFEIMQKNGVDPSNMDEVKAFLDEIEKTNPELYQIFVQAFETLLGSGEDASAPGMVPPAGTPGTPSPDISGALGAMVSPGGMPPSMPMAGGPAGAFPNLAQPPQG